MIIQRPQFIIRTLVILMSILGPLCGWYGPSIVSHVRKFVENDAPTMESIAPRVRPPRKAMMSKEVALRRAIREEARLQRRKRSLQFHANREKAKRQRENRLSLENQRFNPRVNRDGTFNMRFHDALAD